MKKRILTACVLITAFAVPGCGPSFQPSASSLYVKQDGTLTQAVVESFEKEYYSLDEFRSMTEKEVGAYEKISIERLEVKDGTMYLLLDYEDADTYSRYNEAYCFMGTVEEALAAGHSFNMTFRDTEYEEYTTAEATAKKSDHVVILKEEGVVQLEKKVKYASNNVDIITDSMVEVMPIEDEEEYAYIIY